MEELPPPDIQVVFVGAGGKRTNGPRISISGQNSQHAVIHPETWTKEETVERFCASLRKNNGEMEASMRALNRHGCWFDALTELRKGAEPGRGTGKEFSVFLVHLRPAQHTPRVKRWAIPSCGRICACLPALYRRQHDTLPRRASRPTYCRNLRYCMDAL